LFNYAKRSENVTGEIKEENRIEQVRRKIPDEETVYDLAELFKVFGDSTRTRILCCLEVKDLYVGELAEVLNMSISAVSHQLRVLRNAKLVRGVKEGKEVRYSLDDNHVTMMVECGLSHLRERD
jgi:ArsR family transcriptional regulator